MNFDLDLDLDVTPGEIKPLPFVMESEEGATQAWEEKKMKNKIPQAKIPHPIKDRWPIPDKLFQRLSNAVAKEVALLRQVFAEAEAKEKERTWLKNQNDGEIDDNRLVDMATGASNVYKRRGSADPLFGGQQKTPKRLRFVIDLSKSMGRMNSEDRRLDRMAATTLMLMLSLDGFTHKFDYSIVGHDGTSPLIPLVDWGKPAASMEAKRAVLEMMYYNTGSCGTGDETLMACELAIKDVVAKEGDDYFVFLVSDANLGQYGVSPRSIANVMMQDKRVSTYAIFIAGKGDAEYLMSALPLGHGFTVTNTKMLPKVFKDIFTSSLISSSL